MSIKSNTWHYNMSKRRYHRLCDSTYKSRYANIKLAEPVLRPHLIRPRNRFQSKWFKSQHWYYLDSSMMPAAVCYDYECTAASPPLLLLSLVLLLRSARAGPRRPPRTAALEPLRTRTRSGSCGRRARGVQLTCRSARLLPFPLGFHARDWKEVSSCEEKEQRWG